MNAYPPRRTRAVLNCEDVGQDLERPPLAATRLLRAAGVKIPLRAWTELPVDVRWAIATEGAADVINPHAARALLRHIPMRYVELVGEHTTTDDHPLPGVLDCLGLPEAWGRSNWQHLSPFARYVLNVLRNNKRLLWRAFAEINGVPTRRYDGWRGPVAHAEVVVSAPEHIRADVMALLVGGRLLNGRGLILARAAGVRAARAASTTFDLHAETATGAVEIDWAIEVPKSMVLWQGHVSTTAGEFFPAAALVGATTAAVCLLDLLREFDPGLRLREVGLTEEEWQVGHLDPDAATVNLNLPLPIKR
ncbi:MAG: hypothetical protein JW751_17310 [Polyangiaceae bacterium]|nr:hypothetical protein [Polyangiaceae bacterium]